MRIPIKSPDEIEKMAVSGKILSEIMFKLWEFTKAGISTSDIDAYANRLCRKAEVQPAFLGYRLGNLKYPSTICASRNKVIVHGVPDGTPLKPADLLAIDMGVIKDGWYSDMCVTQFVGGSQFENPKNATHTKTQDKQRVLKASRDALERALHQCVPGNQLKNICLTIQETAFKYDCRPMAEFVGHGIGRKLHEEPQIPGYWADGIFEDIKLEQGMVFAIEAILTAGKSTASNTSKEDKWSAWPKDNGMTAVSEHTVAIGNPPRVLTSSQ